MDFCEYINDRHPFCRLLGIKITSVEAGRARGELELRNALSSTPEHLIAPGGVIFALADTVGGVALADLVNEMSPTIDMRIDYLRPATSDLVAKAEVRRHGEDTAVVDVNVHGAEGPVAIARGVFKPGVGEDGTWLTS